MGRKMRTFAEQFEKYHVPEPNTGCWLWTGALDTNGYGKVNAGYRTVRASRVAWELHRGPIPDGMSVCHRCDHRPCVNPEHLFLGTPSDNAADMARKGRSLRGDRNPGARLQSDQVLAARGLLAAGAKTADVAAQFKVSLSAVRRLAGGDTWSSAGPPPREVARWLSGEDAREVRRLVESGEPRASIAKRFGISRKTVFNIGSGRTHGG